MSDRPAGLKAHLTYYRAPPGLVGRVLDALPAETPVPVPRLRFRWPTLWFGGSGALAGALAGAVLVLLVRGPPGIPLTQALVDHHVASVMGDHLTDVQNSNQHVVKPWLSQHADVSPPVEDFTAQGFPLIGGRLDYVAGHMAAVVVYRHDRHVINVFCWAAPGEKAAGPTEGAEQGFNVVSWRGAGLSCFAVSDVEATLLRRLVGLIRGETAKG